MYEVVFQSPDWIVVDKPSGWLTVPSRFEGDDDRFVLGREIEADYGGKLFPVHRLDFEVSGLVLFARTAGAHRSASKWFESRKVHKTYHALSTDRDFSHWPKDLKKADEEIPFAEKLEWKSRILRGKRRTYEHEKGDQALTKVLRQSDHQWILFPLTGRAHQLRFEMSRHGFPILGDSLYGSKLPWQGENAIALRAVQLELSTLTIGDRMGLPPVLNVKGLFE